MHPEHHQELRQRNRHQVNWIVAMLALAVLLVSAAILPLAASAAPLADRPSGAELAPPVLRSAPSAPMQQASTITPTLTVIKTTNGVYAPVPPGPLLAVGSAVAWTYLISNTGSVSVTVDAVVDDPQGPLVAGDCTPEIGEIVAPGEGMTCIVDTENVTAGQYRNLVTVTGTNFLNSSLSTVVTDVSHYFGGGIGISLTKYTNAQDVASATSLYLRQGDPVAWSYRITNTGNVTLTLALTDVGTSGVPGAITCAPTPLTGELAPYTNTLCTMAGTVQAGAYTNTATITGTATISSSWQTTNSDTSYYFGVTTGINLTKYTNAQDVASPTGLYLRQGDTVMWTYRIANTSNVTLTLALTDVGTSDVRGVSDCTPALAGGLAPNASTLCTLTGTVQEGAYTNTATVTGTTAVGAGWQITMADTSHYFGIRPQATISKTTNGEAPTQAPGPYVAPGTAVSWLYTVHNTGNVTLTELTLHDDQEGEIACPSLASGLAPAAQAVCNKANLARAGQYTNTATITGTTALLGGFTPITASVKSFYFGVTAGISLTKYTNGQMVASPTALYLRVGDAVTWTYRITNTSNTPLGGLALSDDRLPGGIPGCAQTLSGGLAAGASVECTASGVVQAGQYTNTATVTGATTLGTPRPATATATASSYYFGVTPGLSLTKYTNGVVATAAPGPYLLVGDSVVWSYRITNTGNAALTGLALTDNRIGAVTNCTPALSGGLAAGASAICTASGTVQAGQYANTAAVAGTTASGVPQTANASSYYFGVRPGIALTKVTNDVAAPVAPGPYLPEGAPVTWTYRITNTSNAPLGNLTLTDDRQGAITSCTPALADGLAPDASAICTASGVAQAGQYANTATVTGTTLGTPRNVTDTANSHYFGVRPGIALTKYTNGELALTPPGPYLTVGAGVTWSYRITNTSNAPLGNLALTDDQQGAITSCTPPLTNGLAPEASAICTASGVVQAGQYANTATVTGATTLGIPQNVQTTASSHYFGVSTDAEVSKQVAPTSADAGEDVTYTLVVTGPAAAQPVTLAITDTLPAALQGETGSVVATLGTATLDPATNTLHWRYTTTAGRADTATITYRARLTTQCTTALTNQARLFVAGVETGQAAATLTLKSALQCDLYLPAVLKPEAIEPAPTLTNGAFDQRPVAWSELINNVAGRLIFQNGETPYTAQSPEWFTWLGGAPNEETKVRQNLTTALPTRYPIYVQFYYLLESAESDCARDRAEVRVGKTGAAPQKVWELGLCGANKTDGAWRLVVPVNLSLEALKGQVVTVEFAATLDGARNSNFLVDTVTLCTTADGIAGIAKCPTVVTTAEENVLPEVAAPDVSPVERPVEGSNAIGTPVSGESDPAANAPVATPASQEAANASTDAAAPVDADVPLSPDSTAQ